NPSPYNTYVHEGLPPTPIGGLGASSLKAALNPANTTYLYFVLAGSDGHSAFASTLAEHERNVQAARDAGLLK
ncbi:MAG: endolytic transglycosylase MltG, partial [Pseudonocardia sp.]|nr:endolytic transglycosylase MltG [Pseudonocardia sp.]